MRDTYHSLADRPIWPLKGTGCFPDVDQYIDEHNDNLDVDQYIDEHDDNVKLSSKGASLCGNGL